MTGSTESPCHECQAVLVAREVAIGSRGGFGFSRRPGLTNPSSLGVQKEIGGVRCGGLVHVC